VWVSAYADVCLDDGEAAVKSLHGSLPAGNGSDRRPAVGAPQDRLKIAEDIGAKTLHMASLARAAGLTDLCQLLEAAALTAAADAVAMSWPAPDDR
jgi:hypothetical protein